MAITLDKAKLPPPNVTQEERESLKSLSKDKDITILPADKGRSTVVLDTASYHSKVSELLRDDKTYEPLKKDPTTGYKQRIVQALKPLKEQKVIDSQLYHKLYPTSETPPTFYGLPKIHKEGVPLRPITSSIGSVTYPLAKYLTGIIGPLVGKTPHHIKNVKDFVTKAKAVNVGPDETIVSYDVKSLFTCIPPDGAVEVVREYLEADTSLHTRTQLSASQVCDLLSLCLTTTYFVYKGQFYRQKHGCAMGSPVSPIVVDLYMERFEKRALQTYTGTKPAVWFRYVDDTWSKVKKAESDQFFKHINEVDNNIKFTQEETSENKLAFLDSLCEVLPDGSIETSVYRKPTHTDQYLMFSSHHPIEHKLGVVRTLNDRAQAVVSQEARLEEEKSHIKKALAKCGYPRWVFRSAQSTKRRKERVNRRTDGQTPSYRPSVVVPYVAGVSEKVRRVLGDFGITTHFKPHNTLRQSLVHPKDKIPKDRKPDVVYGIKCTENTCDQFYIGETSQPLGKRMKQHRRQNTSGYNSAVYDHLQEAGHQFIDKDVVVLDRESKWFERGVKEALYERCERPPLNRQGGLRFQLSHTWDRVIARVPKVLSNSTWCGDTAGQAHTHSSSEEGGRTATETVS